MSQKINPQIKIRAFSKYYTYKHEILLLSSINTNKKLKKEGVQEHYLLIQEDGWFSVEKESSDSKQLFDW